MRAQLREIWSCVGGRDAALDRLHLPPGPSVLPSSFHVDLAAQGLIGLAALAASECLHARGGPATQVSVDRLHAAAEFRSDRYFKVNGALVRDLWDPLAGLYKSKDGWVRIHTNFPHHRQGFLDLLQCESTRSAVADKLQQWSSVDLEEEAARHGLPATALRSYDEWLSHPQHQAISSVPPVEIVRFSAESALRDKMDPWTASAPRPLSRVRVLDLTRIIAGPVAGRTLAAHGADVLHISAVHLPSIDELLLDTGRGKRTAALDLRQPRDKETFRSLVREADVVLQGYRPDGIRELGFGVEELHLLRPGLIVAELRAYGFEGPWAGRRGFDSLTQTATGYNTDEMVAFGDQTPRALPTQALDHGSGYLLALGIMAALRRRHEEGGSYHVKVSLASTGQWLRDLGRVDPTATSFLDPSLDHLSHLCCELDCWQGKFYGLKHSGVIEGFDPHWEYGAQQLGHHDPVWW